MANDTDQLWADYVQSRSPATRDKLILVFAPLTKFVAARVGSTLPRSVEQSDLVSYGMFGLIDAIERFEPERGYKFETFAMPRIKGAILDELRSMDWVPRTVRTRAREIERAIVQFEADHGRSPSDLELASVLDISLDTLNDRLSEVALGGVSALDEVRSSADGEAVTLRDFLADSAGNPGEQVDQQETRRLLAEIIPTMPERDRAVISLYYFESLTMAEIGEIFSISESRVCQIHTKAILSLRSKFRSLS